MSLDPRRRKRWWTLDEILRRMRAAYCGTMTAEYAHLSAKAKKNWLRYRLEGHARDLVEDPAAVLIRAAALPTTKTRRSIPPMMKTSAVDTRPRGTRRRFGARGDLSTATFVSRRALVDASREAERASSSDQGGPARAFSRSELPRGETVRGGGRGVADSRAPGFGGVRGGGWDAVHRRRDGAQGSPEHSQQRLRQTSGGDLHGDEERGAERFQRRGRAVPPGHEDGGEGRVGRGRGG